MSEKVLLARVGRGNSRSIETYLEDGGYAALRTVLTGGWTPEKLTDEVKNQIIGLNAAKLFGIDYGGGAFGRADVSSSFTIGRAQIVKADATEEDVAKVNLGEQAKLGFDPARGWREPYR